MAKDEPFSTRPLQFAAITASFTGMYTEAIRFAHSGLALEIENQVLLNALVFARASLGEISEAKKYAKRPSCLPSDDPLTLVMEANFACLHFVPVDWTRGQLFTRM